MGRRKKNRADALGAAAAKAYRADGTEDFRADPLGSYTGAVIEGTPFEPSQLIYPDGADRAPTQDADDL